MSSFGITPEGIVTDSGFRMLGDRGLEQHQGKVAHRAGCWERMVVYWLTPLLPRSSSGPFPHGSFQCNTAWFAKYLSLGQRVVGQASDFSENNNCLCSSTVLSGFASARANTHSFVTPEMYECEIPHTRRKHVAGETSKRFLSAWFIPENSKPYIRSVMMQRM